MTVATNKTMGAADRMRVRMVGSGNRYVVGGAGSESLPERSAHRTRRRTSTPWGAADWVMTGLLAAAAVGLLATGFRLLGRVRWTRVLTRIGTFYLTSAAIRRASAGRPEAPRGTRRRDEAGRRRVPRTDTGTAVPTTVTPGMELEHLGGEIIPATGLTPQEREPVRR